LSPELDFGGSTGGGSKGEELDFLLAISGDEKLLRRVNEFDGAETCRSTGTGRGSDAKWRVEGGKTQEVLAVFAACV
jgi:trehalose 6-phosphate synthase/phosphatase